MTNEQTASASPDANNKSYNMPGMVSKIDHRRTATGVNKGAPYLVFTFAFTAGGKKQIKTAMAFGQAYRNLTGQSKKSPGLTISDGEQRIYAKFTDGTLSVIDFGLAPMTDERRAELEAEAIVEAAARAVAAKAAEAVIPVAAKRVRPSRSKSAIAARALNAAQAVTGEMSLAA